MHTNCHNLNGLKPVNIQREREDNGIFITLVPKVL